VITKISLLLCHVGENSADLVELVETLQRRGYIVSPLFFLPTDQSTNRLGTNESQQERNITTSSGKNFLSTKEKRGVATDITLIYSLDATPGYDHLQSSTPSIITASFGLDSESPSWMNTTWTLNRIKSKDYLLWRP
jgi:hypothetical protein